MLEPNTGRCLIPRRRGKPLPLAEYLREILSYDPLSGKLRWFTRRRSDFTTANAYNTWNARYSGQIAGWRHNAGYIALTIGREHYLAHRIIWKMMTGIDPIYEVDHDDLDGTNNQWVNLRKATPTQNGANRRCYSMSGFKGVRLLPSGRFGAHIRRDGKFVHLGTFATVEEAHAAYCKAARQIYGEFFNPG